MTTPIPQPSQPPSGTTTGQETTVHALECAQSALHRLQTLGVSPRPECYTVFFAYYEGAHTGLVQVVDAAIRETSGNAYRLLDALMRIHDTFFGLGRKEELLETAAQNIDVEFGHLAQMIDAASQSSRTYGTALDTFNVQLEKLPPHDEVRKAASTMVKETHSVMEKNHRLQGQLDVALTQIGSLRENLDSVKRETMVDTLTGIGNRKAFVTGFAAFAHESIERGEPLALIMIDIDFFKKFNDVYGHTIGDQILKLVAKTLKDNTKGRDLVARYGGEEFALLLPRTGLVDATKVAENLRRLMASKQIVRRDGRQSLGNVTFSLGVTEFVAGEDEMSFVSRADKALYAAKHNGRNCVIASDPPAPATPKAAPESPGRTDNEARPFSDDVIEIDTHRT